MVLPLYCHCTANSSLPQVTLLSADDDVAAGCSTTHPPGHVSMANIDAALSTTALCSVTTDAQGWYTFTGVPCGQYTLQVGRYS